MSLIPVSFTNFNILQISSLLIPQPQCDFCPVNFFLHSRDHFLHALSRPLFSISMLIFFRPSLSFRSLFALGFNSLFLVLNPSAVTTRLATNQGSDEFFAGQSQVQLRKTRWPGPRGSQFLKNRELKQV